MEWMLIARPTSARSTMHTLGSHGHSQHNKSRKQEGREDYDHGYHLGDLDGKEQLFFQKKDRDLEGRH